MLLKKPTQSLKYLIVPAICAFTFMLTMACSFETSHAEEVFTKEHLITEKQEWEYQLIMNEVNRLQAEAELVLNQEPKTFIYPLDKDVISSFGERTHPIKNIKQRHWGIDFITDTGTPIKAVADGEVSLVREGKGGYGLQIEVRHANGFVSKSTHLSEVKVSLGQKVKQGDIIALSGNSGLSQQPHLHFELIKNGKKIDPEKYLKR